MSKLSLPSFQSLPQYGSVALPPTSPRVFLVGEKAASEASVLRASDLPALDRLLGTTSEQFHQSASVLGPRLARETLAQHNLTSFEAWTRYELGQAIEPDFEVLAPFQFRSLGLVIGEGSGPFESWTPGRYVSSSSISFTRRGVLGGVAPRTRCRLTVESDANAKRAKLRFTENGLETGMAIGRDFVRTTDYVIRADASGLQDFIFASLKYYEGVDGNLLKPDGVMLLAANLIYHQQFAMESDDALPFTWPNAAQSELWGGADADAALRDGTAFLDGYLERAFVPSSDGSAPLVEIRRLLDNSFEIFIRRPADHGDLMPLKENVLLIAARAMNPGLLPRGADLMAKIAA